MKKNHRKPRLNIAGFLQWGEQGRVRFAARSSAVLFLGITIVHAIVIGDYLNYDGSPWLKLPGKMAGVVGMAAEDITIKGLVHQDAETVLGAIGVSPGGSLLGFDAAQARRTLEGLDWVQQAKVQRLFPNQLEISLVERVPVAIWQHDDTYSVIDKEGTPMSGFTAAQVVTLPLVTGAGANTAAAELINQLSANPDLSLQVKAAARVGNRRWTLYLDSGVTVLLPENGMKDALAQLKTMDETQQILSKGIRSVDFRIADRVTVAVAEIPADDPAVKKKK
ncbi:cell division protein FtsQ/DivIB [Aestuariivirga sp.]|uniref:cell division protein FtsQ/DivIB n=1 Tax=Aestuariivirga sp. TaxID=2650926 RepID=UPI0039E41EAC